MGAAKTIFMFSGQGSQYFQMGRELFDQDPIFREWMNRLDHIAKELTHHSVVEALYLSEQNKSATFDRTLLTHPAIFMVEYALAQSLINSGIEPDLTLGASLGSFAAAALAGIVGVEDALYAVIKQALALESNCERGGMIAILGNPTLYGENFLSEYSELVAINFSSHFVVAAQHGRIAKIEADLKQRNVTFQRLPVSFAFHSRWIDSAKDVFESCMGAVRFNAARLPFMCCERAAIVSTLPANHFWNVARHPIRFREAIAQLEQSSPHRYIDVGPAGTLATFLRYVLPRSSASKTTTILSPYGRELHNLKVLKEEFRSRDN